MIANDQGFLSPQVNHVVPRRMPGCPNYFEHTVSHPDFVTVADGALGLRHRVVQLSAHPGGPHSGGWMLIYRKTVALEKSAGLGAVAHRHRTERQHSVGTIHL